MKSFITPLYAFRPWRILGELIVTGLGVFLAFWALRSIIGEFQAPVSDTGSFFIAASGIAVTLVSDILYERRQKTVLGSHKNRIGDRALIGLEIIGMAVAMVGIEWMGANSENLLRSLK